MRKLIRADGSTMDLPAGKSMEWLRNQIGADTLTTVTLRHMGNLMHVMLLDDVGHAKGLPFNAMATELYHQNCKPGTTHPILGDVVICPDEDFA